MIVLKPTAKLRKRFSKIDFETLSLVYSLLFISIYKVKKKRSFTLHIKTTKKDYSYYTFQPGKYVFINISDCIIGEKLFQFTLLHEFRHFIQDKVFKIPLTKKNYDETSMDTYMSSPVEADVDSYTKLTSPIVTSLHKRLTKLKTKLTKKSKYMGSKI